MTKKIDEIKGFEQFMDEVEKQKLELIHNAEMRGFKRGYKLCEKQKNKQFQKKIKDIINDINNEIEIAKKSKSENMSVKSTIMMLIGYKKQLEKILKGD